MELEVEVKKLVSYINSLGLEIPRRKPPHEHVGSIIADAVLQVGHQWKTHVGPRLERIRDKYPEASTTSGLSYLLETRGAQELLNWNGEDAHERFRQSIRFFENEQVKTYEDLRKWLESEDNRDRLITKSLRDDKAGIAKIADKTADYYRVLVGLPDAVKVDSRVEEFLTDAGVTVGKYKYKELRAIVQLAAKQLGKRPIDLDSAIWNYQGKREPEVNLAISRKEGVEMEYEYFNAKQAYEFSETKGCKEEVKIIQQMQEPKEWIEAREKWREAKLKGRTPPKEIAGSPWWFNPRTIIGANLVLWEKKKVAGYPLGRNPGQKWISNRKGRLCKYLTTTEGKEWRRNHNVYWLSQT